MEHTPEQTGYWELIDPQTNKSITEHEYYELGHRAAMRKLGWKANAIKAIKVLKPDPVPKPMIQNNWDWNGFINFSRMILQNKLDGTHRGEYKIRMDCEAIWKELEHGELIKHRYAVFTFPDDPEIFRIERLERYDHTINPPVLVSATPDRIILLKDAFKFHPELDPNYRMPVMLSLFEGNEEPLARAHSQQQQLTFKDFVNFLRSSRVQTTDKTSVPMWNAFRFKTPDQIAEELGDEDPKEFYNSRFKDQKIRCKGVNTVGVTALVLDYDSGKTVAEVLEELSGMELFVYSSYSHKPKHHKFRVILPFNEMCPTAEFKSRTAALKEVFSDADPASFSIPQRFFMPSNPEGAEVFEQYQEGERFDWKELHPTKEVEYEATESELTATQRSDLMHGLRLNRIEHGAGLHNIRVALCFSMIKHGFSETDWKEVIPDAADIRVWRDCIRDQARIKNSTVGIIYKAAQGKYKEI